MTVLLALLLGLQAEPVLLRGGRVVGPDGKDREKADVLIRDGRIDAVGPSLEAPENARVVDASGRTVMAGLVDASGGLGFEAAPNEEAREVTPAVRALDMLDLRAPARRYALAAGVTTAYVGPGARNVVGGLGAVVRTGGRRREEILLKEDAALKAVLGPSPASGNYPPRSGPATFYARRPTTRMGVTWELRKALEDARRGREGPADADHEILRLVLAGRLPLRVAASRATDIETALAVAEEFSVAVQIEEGQEAWKLAARLAARKVPVLLRPSFREDPREGLDVRLDAFRVLREAGVETALLPPDGEPAELRAAAALQVRHGASRPDVLRAVTAVPAALLGVAERTGTIEPGRSADLVVFSGDPLDPRSRVDVVLVAGRIEIGGR